MKKIVLLLMIAFCVPASAQQAFDLDHFKHYKLEKKYRKAIALSKLLKPGDSVETFSQSNKNWKKNKKV